MEKKNFTSRRETIRHRQTINAPPEKVFPLLCPVREADWLDGWRYEMIYSETGLVEAGAVFRTPGEGEEDTIWVVTQHDPVTHRVEFVRFTHPSRTCVLKIAVTYKDARHSFVDIAYTYTGITASGNHFIDHFTETVFLDAVTFWENSMNHYFETGRRLKKQDDP